MSMVRQRGSVGVDRSAEADLRGKIHELVRRDSNAVARPMAKAKPRPAISAICCVGCRQIRPQIDALISELRLLREKLTADGQRIERDVVDYAALSQSVIEMTKIITDSMVQVRTADGGDADAGSTGSPMRRSVKRAHRAARQSARTRGI